MNIQKYAKEEIALNQIETALTLFFTQGDLFSVVTLAGAAEEILGELLQDQRGNPGLYGLFSPILEILRPSSRKESKKERSLGHETEVYVHMDLYQEALFLLGRAIEDYEALSGKRSVQMLRFDEEVRVKSPQELHRQ